MSWHMSPRYGHGILVSGYPVLTAVNWTYGECSILKMWTCQDTPGTPLPSLDSLPYPTLQSVDAYVCTYVRSIKWQPNEKRLTIFHECVALSHARFALRARGSPATKHFPCGICLLHTYWVIHPFARFFMYSNLLQNDKKKRSIYVKTRGKNYNEGKDMKLGNYK